MDIIDSKGIFKSDDEIGFMFDEIKFIQEELNNLDNLIVLNYGLTDKDNVEYTHTDRVCAPENTGCIHFKC